MAPFGLNVADSVWSIVMVINNFVIIYIYLAFRLGCCFGVRVSNNGYIYWLFLLLHCGEWRLFRLISYWGVGFCWGRVFGWITRGIARTLYLRRASAQGNCVRGLYFSLCLFVCCLFVYYLFVCLIFICFGRAIYRVVHRFCGLAPWGGCVWESCF